MSAEPNQPLPSSRTEAGAGTLAGDAPTKPDSGGLDCLPLEACAGDMIGGYKLLEQLGEGGFGVVWAAEQREPIRRRVALKIIKLGMDTKQVVARFEIERQALAMMDHPCIAKVFDAGTTGAEPSGSGTANPPTRIPSGRPYFVMELVRGLAITEYCHRHNLPIRARLELFIQVCEAIQHAHQKGIIHRDIKPSNVLVALPDQASTAVPKVIDFGIAKATQHELTELTIFTRQQQFIGTPAYMSPEQAEMSGLDVDTRTDIYSLGVLLYELLTGTTPFDSKELIRAGIDEMRRIIREREPMRPSTRLTQKGSRPGTNQPASNRAALASDLDWIVMRCLEKDRTRRYETANGLAMDLRRHLNNEPVAARPPSAAYRLQKAWRRNQLAYSAACVVALALLLGIIGTSIGMVRAKRSNAAATQAATEAEAAKMAAEALRREAVAAASSLETNLYFSSIALAHRELTASFSSVKQAEWVLDNQCPAPLRNWEWRYLKQRRFAEPMILPNPSGARLHCIDFNADGALLATGGADGRVSIWSFAGNVQPTVVKSLAIHTGFVMAVIFHPRNKEWIASAGFDRKVRVWDWVNDRLVREYAANTDLEYGMAGSIAFSPDGRKLGALGVNQEILIHDLDQSAPPLRLPMQEEPGRCVAFSPNGQWVATGNSKGYLQLWSAASGHLIKTFNQRTPPICGLTFSADSKRLFALRVCAKTNSDC